MSGPVTLPSCSSCSATASGSTSRPPRRCACGGWLLHAPLVFSGRVGTPAAALALVGVSAFSASGMLAEGVVLRAGPGVRVTVVRPGFAQRSDAAWSAPRRNRLRTVAPVTGEAP